MTKDEKKTKEQLIDELAQLCQRVTELGKLKVEHKQSEKVLRESKYGRGSRFTFTLPIKHEGREMGKLSLTKGYNYDIFSL